MLPDRKIFRDESELAANLHVPQLEEMITAVAALIKARSNNISLDDLSSILNRYESILNRLDSHQHITLFSCNSVFDMLVELIQDFMRSEAFRDCDTNSIKQHIRDYDLRSKKLLAIAVTNYLFKGFTKLNGVEIFLNYNCDQDAKIKVSSSNGVNQSYLNIEFAISPMMYILSSRQLISSVSGVDYSQGKMTLEMYGSWDERVSHETPTRAGIKFDLQQPNWIEEVALLAQKWIESIHHPSASRGK
ncbi:MAG: hypothetical protein OHK0017_06120 [Patescibacteria group bacterium]